MLTPLPASQLDSKLPKVRAVAFPGRCSLGLARAMGHSQSSSGWYGGVQARYICCPASCWTRWSVVDWDMKLRGCHLILVSSQPASPSDQQGLDILWDSASPTSLPSSPLAFLLPPTQSLHLSQRNAEKDSWGHHSLSCVGFVSSIPVHWSKFTSTNFWNSSSRLGIYVKKDAQGVVTLGAEIGGDCNGKWEKHEPPCGLLMFCFLCFSLGAVYTARFSLWTFIRCVYLSASM